MTHFTPQSLSVFLTMLASRREKGTLALCSTRVLPLMLKQCVGQPGWVLQQMSLHAGHVNCIACGTNCCGLGMAFPSSVLPLRLSKPPSLTPRGGMERRTGGTERQRLKTIYWKQQ